MKVKRSKYDIFVEAACLLCLMGGCIYLAVIWKSIPDEIPIHYNFAGEVDKMGNRKSIFFIVIVNWLIYLFITAIEQIPGIWNTGVPVTPRNQEKVYRILKNMIGSTKLECVVIFSYLMMQSITARSLPAAFLPISMGALFGIMVYFIVRLVQAR
ncbi:MAG: DUF1648 domain-containing protein [Lachnospiraceae bacterium]|nr:DUF1648 domain-containing protein [Lachnospiraceae bacterium]